MSEELPLYRGWRNVPEGLATKNQLSNADLPRKPGGPPVAEVQAGNYRGKPDVFDLYSVAESQPTTAKAAVAGRIGSASRTCTGCGAHSEQLLGLAVERRLVCEVCHLIATLTTRRDRAVERRADACKEAKRLLLDRDRLMVWTTGTHRPAPPSGGQPKCLAIRIQAAGWDGKPVMDVTVAVAGLRSKLMPAAAVTLADALPTLEAALAGRPLITWGTEKAPLSWHVYEHLHADPDTRAQAHRHPLHVKRTTDLEALVASWRGDLDAEGRDKPLLPPGSTDRMLALARAIAAEGPDLADPCGLCFHERADHPQDDKRWHSRAGWHMWTPLTEEVHGG